MILNEINKIAHYQIIMPFKVCIQMPPRIICIKKDLPTPVSLFFSKSLIEILFLKRFKIFSCYLITIITVILSSPIFLSINRGLIPFCNYAWVVFLETSTNCAMILQSKVLSEF